VAGMFFEAEVVAVGVLEGAESGAVAFAAGGGEGDAFAFQGGDGAV